MLDKITIVDFDDSFTYNIASIVYREEQSCRVIRHDRFFQLHCQRYQFVQSRHAVILGPGPGHPGEHRAYFSAIADLLKNRSVYVMGICLGHQILGMINGLEIRPVSDQLHGRTVEIVDKGEKFTVQRYNSLGVFRDQQEQGIQHFERGISYQFHPESIGTDENLHFFNDLLKFLRS